MRGKIKERLAHSGRIIGKNSGFTLIELLVALIILAIIIAIAFSVYRFYIEKAKITLAQSALSSAQKTLSIYLVDNKKFPAVIDFTTCVDESGRTVFDPSACDQLKTDLVPDSFSYSPSADATSYALTARARDANNTLMTLTEKTITQGN